MCPSPSSARAMTPSDGADDADVPEEPESSEQAERADSERAERRPGWCELPVANP